MPGSKTPAIGLTPTSLNYAADEGGSDPAGQTVAVSNTGQHGSTLSCSVTDDAGGWLAEAPTSGVGDGATVTVSVSIAGLSAGSYSATVTFADPNASNTPQTVAVGLTVNPAVVHGSASLPVAGAFAATGRKQAAGASTLSAASAEQVTGSKLAAGAATLAAVSGVTDSARKLAAGGSTLTAAAALSASGHEVVPVVHGSATLPVSGSFSSAGRKQARVNGLIFATSGEQATGSKLALGASTLTATATAADTGSKLAAGASTLTAATTLSETGHQVGVPAKVPAGSLGMMGYGV